MSRFPSVARRSLAAAIAVVLTGALLGPSASAQVGPLLPPPPGDRRPNPAPAFEPQPTPAFAPPPALAPPPAPRPGLALPEPGPLLLPPIDPNAGRPVAPDIESPSYAAWEEILRALALSLIPPNFEREIDWGKQNRATSGINADIRNGQLRLAKRTTLVNHGFWRKYRVTPVDFARNFVLTIRDLGERDDRQYLYISAQFKADVEARFEFWTLGVKGLNGSLWGVGTMRIDVACNYKVEPAVDNGLPAIRLVPQIDGVNLTLVEYTARKIGLLRGDMADAVGDGSRAILREIVNGQEDKLLVKLRAAVEKEKGRLTVSPGAWLFAK